MFTLTLPEEYNSIGVGDLPVVGDIISFRTEAKSKRMFATVAVWQNTNARDADKDPITTFNMIITNNTVPNYNSLRDDPKFAALVSTLKTAILNVAKIQHPVLDTAILD